jgi:hypothetical protein
VSKKAVTIIDDRQPDDVRRPCPSPDPQIRDYLAGRLIK